MEVVKQIYTCIYVYIDIDSAVRDALRIAYTVKQSLMKYYHTYVLEIVMSNRWHYAYSVPDSAASESIGSIGRRTSFEQWMHPLPINLPTYQSTHQQ